MDRIFITVPALFGQLDALLTDSRLKLEFLCIKELRESFSIKFFLSRLLPLVKIANSTLLARVGNFGLERAVLHWVFESVRVVLSLELQLCIIVLRLVFHVVILLSGTLRVVVCVDVWTTSYFKFFLDGLL